MLHKADAEALRVQNRAIVLDQFRRRGHATRRDLAQATGLSLSSASSIASELLRAGLLEEVLDNDRRARRGRPEIRLQLRGEASLVAAVKIAVGEIAVRIVDYAFVTRHETTRKVDLATLSEEALARLLVDCISRAFEAAGGRPERRGRIVVSVQGKTDGAQRKLLWSPVMAVRDLDLAEPVAQATDLPTSVFNDCSLMPESFRWEPVFPDQDFATLFIGFGVGMGLRLQGRTFQASGSSSVEFGHLIHQPGGLPCRCGNLGCVEAYAGDYGIWSAAGGKESARRPDRVATQDMALLAAKARAGEPRARDAFRKAGEAIGYGLGRLFTLIDPLPIVFTGSGTEAMDVLEPSIRDGIAASSIEGVGADVAFKVVADADEMIFRASSAHALGALDTDFCRAVSAARTEAA